MFVKSSSSRKVHVLDGKRRTRKGEGEEGKGGPTAWLQWLENLPGAMTNQY